MADSDDDEDDDALPSHVPVRPYNDDIFIAPHRPPARQRKPRVFKPRPPQERKRIEKSLLSATCAETAESVLQDALRRQEADGLNVGGLTAHLAPERFRGMSLSKFGVGESGRVAKTTPMTSGGANLPYPRKAKQWKEGKSMELMDLAFTPVRRCADGLSRKNYTPISLPYFTVADEEEAADPAAGDGARKGRPTMKHIDEGNSNAAKELFLSPDSELMEDNILLLQLPSVLPEVLDPMEEVHREQEDAASAGAGTSITRLPDGMIGKLKIHKSGKVRMEIGGLPFCVDPGSATFFHQELACVCPLAKEIVNLGSIQNRVVLTPDIDAMLNAAEHEEASKTAAD